ncbi:MAG: ABC transporter ATP-binding protein [Rhodospirillaceae bacterium]|nr:MAG: ABC transporter ATP-binding protein [Rhodospirillaceae bacterium]
MTQHPPDVSKISGARAPGGGIQSSTAEPPAIVLDRVHLTLEGPAGPVNILRGVDLSVAAGATVGIVGPSGSGKTTMLMVIAGLERVTQGNIRVAGRDYTGLSEDDLALFRRDHIGVVFQSFHLIPTMTALENVAVPLEFAGRKDAFDRAAAQLQAVGLGHRMDHYPGQMSGGEQQRVAIARASAMTPRILLADEPTGNLDSATGTQIIDLLFDPARRAGSTLILITHDQALAAMCDRVVHIADGVIAS